MITFAIAVFFLLITPGPGVLTTAGVGAAFGYRPGIMYVTGLCLGSNLVMVAVATGLAALVFGVPWVRPVLLTASALYLGYLALKIAFAGSKIGFMEAQRQPGLVDGLMLQFINPKAYVVATTLFSGFAFMPGAPLAEAVTKFVILNVIWIPIHIVWLHAGVALNRLDLPPRSQRMINLGMAAALMIVVALALFAQRSP